MCCWRLFSVESFLAVALSESLDFNITIYSFFVVAKGIQFVVKGINFVAKGIKFVVAKGDKICY